MYGHTMRISGAGFRNRDVRYSFDKPVSLQTERNEFGQQLSEGNTVDVSLSGIAINTTANVENGQFVEMHIEGFGSIRGSVARVYEGGAAVTFDEDEKAREKLSETIRNLNQLA